MYYELREQARLYAEGKMPLEWDREDKYLIIAFYSHMVDFLVNKIVINH